MNDEALESYLFNRHLRGLADTSEPGLLHEASTSTDVRVGADDGVVLAATVWDPPARERGHVVVVAGATGVRRQYYRRFASFLAAEGFAVVTFDYRGIGESRASDASPSMHDWGERDLASIVAWAADHLGKGRVAVVGHSVGGQLVGLLPDASRVSALVTVAAQSGDYRLWPLPARLALAVFWYGVVPGVTRAVGYLPGAISGGEDLPSGVALEWARWCRTRGYFVGGDGAPRRDGFAKLAAPVLAYGFDDDGYAPAAAVDALHALYTDARIERRQIPRRAHKVGHFGFFRDEHRALWKEAADFLAAHVP